MITLLPEVKGLILNGDCLNVLKELPDNSVDSIVTDPPYHLTSMTKPRYDLDDYDNGKGNPFARRQANMKGFMGKEWDGGDIAFNKDLWKECLRVLKPGAYLLAFGGTRTYHRMACAIEDAGFEVRDMIEWVYGSGFPKSLNIGKAIEKMKGDYKTETRKGAGSTGKSYISNTEEYVGGDKGVFKKEYESVLVNNEWEGYGTALKPAHEPIVMARKPLAEKTVAENVLKYGTGGINIDESRVGFVNKEDYDESTKKNQHEDFGTKPMTNNNVYGDYSMIQPKNYAPIGRFPANLIHDGSGEVLKEFPQSNNQGHWSKTKTTGFGEFGNGKSEYLGVGEKDKIGGSVARFFKQCEFTEQDFEYAPFFYSAKASKSERNDGCEELPEKEVQIQQPHNSKSLEERYAMKFRNHHPTVKPLKLMEYLIKMVTPKGGIVLDPFAGSGTTLVASKKLGYKYIGIELTPEYIPIINARLNSVTQTTL